MRFLHASLVTFIPVLLVAACGGSVVSAPVDASSDATSSDGAVDASKDAGGDGARSDAGCFVGAPDCAPDAGHDAGSTACGAETCSASEYCETVSGGAQPLDGGTSTSYVCTPLPAACASTPSCACVEANGAVVGCTCTEVDGRASVTCEIQ